MDNVDCRCGKAYMSYTLVGEDFWLGTPHNTTIKVNGYGRDCICNHCGTIYDNFDPFMVKIAGMYSSLRCNSLPKGSRHH